MKDRFEIQEKVGQGGAGAVYKAYDTTLDRVVAIKKLRTSPIDGKDVSEVSGSHATQEALLREAKHLSSLQHPNIVTVYDVGINEEEAYVVMEFLTGDTLSDVVDKAALPVEDFVKVTEQALEGLCAAHANGMLHRDIKPANLMIVWDKSGEYRVKLLDFGLAKVSEGPAQQTLDQGGTILGSIHFMAPEQFEMKPLDQRSDLYSLGCVLYYSLTGEYPFQGDTSPQVMASHIQARKWPLSQFRHDIPGNIEQWLEKLMARNPEDRFPDSRTALAEFRRTCHEPDSPPVDPEPTPAQTSSPTTPNASATQPAFTPTIRQKPLVVTPPPVQSETNRTGLWIGIACAFAVGIAGAFFYFNSSRGTISQATDPETVASTEESTGGNKNRSMSAAKSAEPVEEKAPEPAIAEVPKVSEEPSTTVPAPSPTTAPTSIDETVFDPFRVNEIHAMMGREIIVQGEIRGAGESRSGRSRYLDFSRRPGEAISLTFFVNEADVSMDALRDLDGKVIRTSGEVIDVFGKTYIKVSNFEDIKVVED